MEWGLDKGPSHTMKALKNLKVLLLHCIHTKHLKFVQRRGKILILIPVQRKSPNQPIPPPYVKPLNLENSKNPSGKSFPHWASWPPHLSPNLCPSAHRPGSIVVDCQCFFQPDPKISRAVVERTFQDRTSNTTGLWLGSSYRLQEFSVDSKWNKSLPSVLMDNSLCHSTLRTSQILLCQSKNKSLIRLDHWALS